MVTKDPKKYHRSPGPVVVSVERLALGGDGVGKEITGPAAGRTCFVSDGVPGEEVEVELTDIRKRFSRGNVRRVMQASPNRVKPPCRIADQCGGCAWQHVEPKEQGRALGEFVLFRRWIEKTVCHRYGKGKLWAIESSPPSCPVDRWGSCDGIPPAPGAGVVPTRNTRSHGQESANAHPVKKS